jgi:hypothetical protein
MIASAIGGSIATLREKFACRTCAELVPVARRAHNSKESGKMTSLLNE